MAGQGQFVVAGDPWPSYNVTMATAIGGLTIEEFEQLPNALARNHELVDGRLVDVSEILSVTTFFAVSWVAYWVPTCGSMSSGA